ncbi:hypothetical protein MUK42_12001 [Musa troglodytarum]|uniref:DUF8204 domain-containing protein n=1 Tax=Musa troglodytarum TaxID=320322 RepID=A0A9E7JU67_9LILI|nr:hypothetical protein MUK42_12001 [Musa troglodytarum]
MTGEPPDEDGLNSADGTGDGDPRRVPDPPTYSGKSCKGCLYYSSRLKSDGCNPVCVGIGRTLPQVPNSIIGDSETEATKDGRSLSDFKYACVGYSVFLNKKDNTAEKPENQAELPFCVGIEILADRRTSTAGHIPANVNKEGDGLFRKNAGVVASGVARNLNKVGNYIKENIDDILYPYRKPPK